MSKDPASRHFRNSFTVMVLAVPLLVTGCVEIPGRTELEARPLPPEPLSGAYAVAVLPPGDGWSAVRFLVPPTDWREEDGTSVVRIVAENQGEATPEGRAGVFFVRGGELEIGLITQGLFDWTLIHSQAQPETLDVVVVFAGIDLPETTRIRFGLASPSGELPTAEGTVRLLGNSTGAIVSHYLETEAGVSASEDVEVEDTRASSPVGKGPGALTVRASQQISRQGLFFAQTSVDARTPRAGTWSLDVNIDGMTQRASEAIQDAGPAGGNFFSQIASIGQSADSSLRIETGTLDVGWRTQFMAILVPLNVTQFDLKPDGVLQYVGGPPVANHSADAQNSRRSPSLQLLYR